MERETWIDLAIRDVCELDPPKECPEAVYIRVDDLRQIIERHAGPRVETGDEAKVAEEYWRTHREGGGTDNDLRCFIQGWVACAAQPRAGVGDGFGPLSDDAKAHAHRAALNGVLDAARALADCNLPGGASLGMFNRLIGAFTLYDHVRLGGA